MAISTLKDLLPQEKLRGRPTQFPAKEPSGRIWPHGEFSLGYVPQRPDDAQRLGEFNPCSLGDEWMVGLTEGAEPLNLIDVPKSHKPAKRGLKGITQYGRNMVKGLGALVGRQYPNHRMTFCTITLPEMTQEQRTASVIHWPEFLRELLQWVSRRLRPLGIPEIVCFVTEIQPKRLASSGQGCLHLHGFWLNKPAKSGHWSLDPNGVREWVSKFWARKLDNPSLGHFNVNVKPVVGSVTSYLAKYMGKGGEVLAEAIEDWGEGVCPATWWNMTARSREWVKKNTLTGKDVGHLIETMLEYGWNTNIDDICVFLKHVEIEFDGALITVGWRGRFTEEVRSDLTGMLQSARRAAD